MHTLPTPLSAALEVPMQNGLERRFASPHDAVDFLENEWPIKYERVIKSCHGAINRQIPLAVSREAFVAACVEAELLIVAQALAPQLSISGAACYASRAAVAESQEVSAARGSR